jgi:hypothetical protein
MFTQNKYTSWYFNIIDKAKSRTTSEYTERHHIVPRSMGGDNSDENLVDITAREHFVCHLLLVKMTDGENKKKMSRALWLMAKGGKKRYSPSSRLYETARKEFIEAQKGHPNYLQSQTEESKEKIRASMKQLVGEMTPEERSVRTKNSWSSPESWTEERKQRIADSLNGIKLSDNHRQSISNARNVYLETLTEQERNDKYGSTNKGKSWKLVDGKRVWFEKEN